jgi:nucleoside-diphosphate-sugar epimerase
VKKALTIVIGFVHDFAAGCWAATVLAIYWLTAQSVPSGLDPVIVSLKKQFFWFGIACVVTVFATGAGRTFTYVGNVVQANLLAMSAPRLGGEVVNIGCGKRTSLNELLDVLKKVFRSQVRPVYQEARVGDVRHSVADIQKGRTLLNFNPREDVEMGLAKTVDYFREIVRKRGA